MDKIVDRNAETQENDEVDRVGDTVDPDDVDRNKSTQGTIFYISFFISHYIQNHQK